MSAMSLSLSSHQTHVWAVLAGAVLAGGVLRGLTGFGAALLMAPVLTQVVSARETMGLVILLSALPFSLSRLGSVGRMADRELILPLTLSALVGLPIGFVLISMVPAKLFSILIGVLVIGSALVMMCGINLARQRSLPLSLGIGAMSGVLTGFAGIGGPPAILYVLGVEPDSHRARATFLVYFALLYPLALVAIAAMGLLSFAEFLQGMLLAPLFYLGGRVGEMLFRKTRKEHFRPFVLAILVCAGTVAITRNDANANEVYAVVSVQKRFWCKTHSRSATAHMHAKKWWACNKTYPLKNIRLNSFKRGVECGTPIARNNSS